MNVNVVSERETYLLVTRSDYPGGRFAVVERRNGRLYTCRSCKRAGVPLDQLSALSEILDESDWMDRATAEAKLDGAAMRWRELAEHMR